jgi:hypothetical protein
MSTESSNTGFDRPPTVEVDAITAGAAGRGGWLTDVLGQLDAIRKLPGGWDSHGGEPIRGEIVAATEKLAKSLARFPEVPRPHASPTAAGGVQLEWEAGGAYFEIHIEEPTEAQCYFERQSPPSEDEFIFHDGDDVSVLAKFAARVSGS